MWFFIGVFAYRTLSAVLAYSHMANFLMQTRDQALLLLACTAENVAFIQALKYKTMEECEVEQDVIRRTKTVDDENFHLWKTSTIVQFHALWPRKYYRCIDFNNWEEAMKVVDKIYKKRK